ncbi:MAG: CDP-glucose 4,6-dehydratase [Polyangiaceae bacterium]
MEDLVGALRRHYENRSVLVTGHTGFKGTWLSHWLMKLGARVSGYALAPDTTPSLFELTHMSARVPTTLADLGELATLRETFERSQPDTVFHLAAQPLVRKSYRVPVETFATNVMGTVHLLECARHTPSVKTVVIVTSDKCYENLEHIWPYRETDRMGGHDPYSASKGCAELVTAAYRSSFLRDRGVGVASARAGNVIGGGDWAEDRLIPDIVRGAASGTPVLIRNPASTRPWQHVLEPLSGYLMLGMCVSQDPTRFADGWNFGPNEGEDGVPAGRVATQFSKELGRGEIVLGQAPPDAALHEARLLRVDSTKARVELGFRPRLTLDDALSMTAEFYRANLDWSGPRPPESTGPERALLEEQIGRYEQRMG